MYDCVKKIIGFTEERKTDLFHFLLIRILLVMNCIICVLQNGSKRNKSKH